MKLCGGGYSRVIKDNGVIALFADNIFAARLIESNEKMFRYTLVYDKGTGTDFLNAKVKPLKSHELILIFYKHKPTYNPQWWYSVPYAKTLAGKQSTNYGKMNRAVSESPDGRRYPLSVLRFPRDGSRVHPTQKPVALCEWLIRTYTNENEIVLDPCFGSGTTCVAAKNANRKYIGFELNEEYFNIAQQRLK